MKSLKRSKLLTATDKALLEQCRAAVARIDPSAELILYGSRARGEGRQDSDWDLLVLMAAEPDADARRTIRQALYEIEWSTGEVISTLIRSRKHWKSPVFRQSPFYANVEQEGLRLWAGTKN